MTRYEKRVKRLRERVVKNMKNAEKETKPKGKKQSETKDTK